MPRVGWPKGENRSVVMPSAVMVTTDALAAATIAVRSSAVTVVLPVLVVVAVAGFWVPATGARRDERADEGGGAARGEHGREGRRGDDAAETAAPGARTAARASALPGPGRDTGSVAVALATVHGAAGSKRGGKPARAARGRGRAPAGREAARRPAGRCPASGRRAGWDRTSGMRSCDDMRVDCTQSTPGA